MTRSITLRICVIAAIAVCTQSATQGADGELEPAPIIGSYGSAAVASDSERLLAPTTRASQTVRFVEPAVAFSDGSPERNAIAPVSFVGLESADATCEMPSCPTCVPGVFGGASYLYLKPTVRGLDYAITEDGSSLTVGRGEIHALEYDRDSGVRGNLGYRTSTGWALAVRFTTIEFEGRSQVERPPGIGQLFSTRSHPDGNEEADTAGAHGGLDYQVIDLEASKRIIDGPFANVSLFGGLRWADIQLANVLDFDGRDFVMGQIRERTRTDGTGLQFGGEFIWQLAGGFGLTGRASGGLMRASFDTQRLETNLNQNVVLVDFTDQFDQVLPNVELAAGVSWSRGPVAIGFAYEIVNWFNAYDRAMFIDDIHEASFGPFSTDVMLEGFTVNFSFSR